MKSLIRPQSRVRFAPLRSSQWHGLWALAVIATTLIISGLAKAEAGLVSSSHLGFAIANQSSTGFRNASGSLVFLDIVRPTGTFGFGVRTAAQGSEVGQGPAKSYYRLGAGPLVSWGISPGWQLQSSIGFFHETALDQDRQKIYQSHGVAELVGWERLYRLSSHAAATFGGFAIHHSGGTSPSQGVPMGAAAMSSVNRGFSQGVEVGLQVAL